MSPVSLRGLAVHIHVESTYCSTVWDEQVTEDQHQSRSHCGCLEQSLVSSCVYFQDLCLRDQGTLKK